MEYPLKFCLHRSGHKDTSALSIAEGIASDILLISSLPSPEPAELRDRDPAGGKL